MKYSSEALDKIMTRHNISTGQISREVNCSKAVVSFIRKGKYSAKKSFVLTNIINYLERKGIDCSNVTSSQSKKTKEETPMIDFNILNHFELKNNPFSAAIPAPRQVWQSKQLANTEEFIINSALNQGFLLVAGEVGTGKSTMLRRIVQQLSKQDRVKLSMPDKTFVEKISSGTIADFIIQDFGGMEAPRSYKKRARVTREVIKRNTDNNVRMIIIIDEGQGLHPNTLRSLKRFWEGMGAYNSLLSVIIVGQPYIFNTLSAGNMSEVDQRLDKIQLMPFHQQFDVHDYINHKMKLAGSEEQVFTAEAAALIQKRAATPLLVNNLCKKALCEAYKMQEHCVTEELINAI